MTETRTTDQRLTPAATQPYTRPDLLPFGQQVQWLRDRMAKRGETETEAARSLLENM